MRSPLILCSLGLTCLMLTAGCGNKATDQAGANSSTAASPEQQAAGQQAAQQAAKQAAAIQAAGLAHKNGH